MVYNQNSCLKITKKAEVIILRFLIACFFYDSFLFRNIYAFVSSSLRFGSFFASKTML